MNASPQPPTFRVPAHIDIDPASQSSSALTGAGYSLTLFHSILQGGDTPQQDQCWEITGIWLPVFVAYEVNEAGEATPMARVAVRLLAGGLPIYEDEHEPEELLTVAIGGPRGGRVYALNTRFHESLQTPVYVPPVRQLELQVLVVPTPNYKEEVIEHIVPQRVVGVSSEYRHVSGKEVLPQLGLLTYNVRSLRE